MLVLWLKKISSNPAHFEQIPSCPLTGIIKPIYKARVKILCLACEDAIFANKKLFKTPSFKAGFLFYPCMMWRKLLAPLSNLYYTLTVTV